jgi:hypothetical protein
LQRAIALALARREESWQLRAKTCCRIFANAYNLCAGYVVHRALRDVEVNEDARHAVIETGSEVEVLFWQARDATNRCGPTQLAATLNGGRIRGQEEG